MTIAAYMVLGDLARRGIALDVDRTEDPAGRLRLTAPAGALTEADRQAIAHHRERLLLLLDPPHGPVAPPAPPAPPDACPACGRKADWKALTLPGRFLCGHCWRPWGTPIPKMEDSADV